MTHRYLRHIPSERQVRTVASSSEKISAPYHRVTPPQFLCLGRAIRSRSRVHLCNAVVRVRHQRPATPALACQLSSSSLLRPQRSPLCDKTAHASNQVTTFASFLLSIKYRDWSGTGGTLDRAGLARVLRGWGLTGFGTAAVPALARTCVTSSEMRGFFASLRMTTEPSGLNGWNLAARRRGA
jgi:hypothetical protein